MAIFDHINFMDGRMSRMAEKKRVVTDEGLRELKAELEELRSVKRRDVAESLKEARAQGDLSENAEFDAAKDEQRDIEARIEELEALLKNVEVIYTDEIDKEKVNVGCTVTIKDVANGNVQTFKMVGSTEADILNNKISNESPIGAALIGAKPGEKVTVEAPNGSFQFEVVEIN